MASPATVLSGADWIWEDYFQSKTCTKGTRCSSSVQSHSRAPLSLTARLIYNRRRLCNFQNCAARICGEHGATLEPGRLTPPTSTRSKPGLALRSHLPGSDSFPGEVAMSRLTHG
ncbi:hypothetical protein DPEC_G00228040 [Dallia pectoralis]|uniref:Uncharacterized protein n=1 Tax=Dallia pectoralis TaxID=75939 RepID=A0ACC2G152_DALPE|nr:hypothetical protein DPEC_G00228040 [Dallia pectoralis]